MTTALRVPTALPRADLLVYDRAVALEAAARAEAIRARQWAESLANEADEALWKVRVRLGVK